MAQTFSYDRMLASLYRSIAEPAALVDFLEQLNLGTHSHVSAILAHDYSTGRGSLPAIVGMPANAVVEYERRYGAENIWMERIAPRLTEGFVGNSDALVPLAELRDTTFWREYLRLVDIDHCLGLCGVKDATNVAQLSLCRSHRAGNYNAAEVELAMRLAPHWVNACQIRKQFGTLHDTVLSLETALNRISLAVVFLDGNGDVSRLNHGAEKMLHSGDVVTLRNGRLFARHSVDAHRLGEVIAAATRAASLHNTTPPAAMRLTLRNAAGVPAAFASIRPSTFGSIEGRFDRQHCTIVFMRSLAAASTQDLSDALRELFGLTAAEARFAVALHAQGDLASAATSSGVSVEAARSRLKVIFDKTDAHNQAMLVKVIEELRSVLGHDTGA